MPKPWPHQLQAERALTTARESGERSALMVMATGLGKNYTAALAFDRFKRSIRRLGRRIRLLFLAHQSDILDQARETFEMVFGSRMTCGTFNGITKEAKANAVFATFQSADSGLFGRMRRERRPFGRRGFDYVIVDESHHSHARTYRRVIRYFKPRFMIGMTATPDRTDLQDIREIYGNEVYSLPLEEGLAKGLLTPVDYRLVTDGLHDLSILDTPVGRLSIKRLNKTLFIPRRDKEIARIILRHAKRIENPRVMIFCPSIQYCDRLERNLPNAVAIHSMLPDKEQSERLTQFRACEYDIVLTVDKFNEGIDIPEANMIVFLRSTASRLIFFQQLGRGLRKVRGKKNVLVLDFAANCERLQIVNKLWSAVTDIERPGAGRTKDTAVSVDIGTVKFSHVAKRIIDVLNRIHQGYTKEVLLSQLKRLKRTLGRVPTANDISDGSRRDECAHVGTFAKVFGSLPEAQRAAGMEPYVTEDASPEELIAQLKRLKKKLGRVPGDRDINAASMRGECSSPGAFRRAFGSIPNAQRAAGMRPHRATNVSSQELIAQLKQLKKKLGRVPTGRDINAASKRGECAGLSAFSRAFGSTADIQRAAGMQPPRAIDTSRSSLIVQLKKLKKKLGRVPVSPDIAAASKRGECAAPATFATHFGSLTAAHRAAGLRPQRRKDVSHTELIAELKKLKKKLGRVPTTSDISEASKRRECASPGTLAKRFGSIPDALKAAGMRLSRAIDTSRSALIAQLKKLKKKLGKVPGELDINAASKRRECAGAGTFRRVFGSIRKAQRVAGMKPYHADTLPSQLIAQLKKLKKKLGRVPTGRDINAASKRGECASAPAFQRAFGSMPDAQRAAGMTPTRQSPRPRRTGPRRKK
ncbi:MAG: DEAD/DEAH box helicase [Parcubacteria group bacterium]|nr:DEAD/DEAH box helicase [Parcubacteria group bacterium]